MGFRKKKTLLDQAGEYVETALGQAKDFMQDKAMPAVADAKEKAAPVVAAGAATVAAKATEAKDYAETKAAELNGSKPKKRSKVKMLLLFATVGGVVAFVAKKLQGSDGGGWQSSYEPAPPPSPASSVPPAATEVPAEEPTAMTDESMPDPLSDPLPSDSER